MIKSLPNPCPVLQTGLALGALKHAGFVATWNWIIDFFKSIKNYIPVGINNRSGNVYIVAGKGIDVKTSDKTITISLGEGKTEDDGKGDDGDGSGEGEGGGNGSGDGDGDWYPPESLNDDGGIAALGAGGGMFKWDKDTRTMGPGGCMVARQWVTATGTGLSDRTDGLYQLCVTISTLGSVSAAVVNDSTLGKPPTQTQCWIPIYQITDGEIATDYRGAFVVPAYE